MDFALFHPKVVHIPMALAVLMPLVAGSLAVAWTTSWLPPRAWSIAVALQAVLFLGAVAAINTGGREEHRVESVVAESHIEAHEELATVFAGVSAVVFAVAALALVLRRKKAGLVLAGLTVLGSFVVLTLGIKAGHAGGELVYKYNAASAYSTGAPPD